MSPFLGQKYQKVNGFDLGTHIPWTNEVSWVEKYWSHPLVNSKNIISVQQTCDLHMKMVASHCRGNNKRNHGWSGSTSSGSTAWWVGSRCRWRSESSWTVSGGYQSVYCYRDCRHRISWVSSRSLYSSSLVLILSLCSDNRWKTTSLLLLTGLRRLTVNLTVKWLKSLLN